VGFVFVAVLGCVAVPAAVAARVPGFVDKAGRAGGGQTVGFAGIGFDPQGSYRCHFYTGTAPYALEHSLYSPEVAARDLELLLCATPAWGRTFPAATVTVRVQYNTGLTVAGSGDDGDDDDEGGGGGGGADAGNFTNATNSNATRATRRRLASGAGTVTEVGDGKVLFADASGSYWSFVEGPEKTFDFALEVRGISACRARTTQKKHILKLLSSGLRFICGVARGCERWWLTQLAERSLSSSFFYLWG